MEFATVATKPYDDQRPGTAGLRKKVAVFRQPNYLENFIQAVFDAARLDDGATLIVGGDGRFFNREAIQSILAIALANGISRIVVGRDGLLSTPAASNLIRAHDADGGFVLTASHNPGGPDGDFGIKFSVRGGGQAPASLTDSIYARSREIRKYRIARTDPIRLDRLGVTVLDGASIEVIDPITDYASMLESLFDFDRIRTLLSGGKFRLCFDAMHAVTGPYAREILEQRLGASPGSVINAIPREDFGRGHPDPNPVDAAELVALMCSDTPPDLGAASDGDGDRNMVLGPHFLVSPGDSLAVLAANARLAPGYRDGLRGVARSMPTSRAVDRVAEALGIPCYETPTGWRFFANLLESGRITLCGEESFGTGSNHVREKDGLWAVLFWLDLVAATSTGVAGLVRRHWAEYGRHFYARHDYFVADASRANALIEHLEGRLSTLAGRSHSELCVTRADSFDYTDPVDGSVTPRQGIRVFLNDDARIVYRLSGTGTGGATLRVYLERFVADPAHHARDRHDVLNGVAAASRQLAGIAASTGLTQPTAVI